MPFSITKCIENKHFVQNWPDQGQIKFDNYSTKYREELPNVLEDFNLQVEGEEKVGIVGRTGAGKSSLSLALFRK